jgi:hypothetical protein
MSAYIGFGGHCITFFPEIERQNFYDLTGDWTILQWRNGYLTGSASAMAKVWGVQNRIIALKKGCRAKSLIEI